MPRTGTAPAAATGPSSRPRRPPPVRRAPVRDASPPEGPAAPRQQDGASPPVQRLVQIVTSWHPLRGTRYTDDPDEGRQELPLRTFDDLWSQVQDAVRGSGDRTLMAEFKKNQPSVMEQTRKWVSDSAVGEKGGKHSPKFGRKKHDVDYSTVLELARALVGWVLQKPGRHEEKEYARWVANDDTVAADLDAVLTKVRGWIDGLGGADPAQFSTKKTAFELERALNELKTGKGTPRTHSEQGPAEFGPYQRHFDAPGSAHPTGFRGDFLAVLDDPARYDVRDKIIVLHDLYEYFKDDTTRALPEPERAGEGVLEMTPKGPSGRNILATQDLLDDGTAKVGTDRGSSKAVRNERADSTRTARAHRIPVWAGASHTTARMLHLAREAGATTDELNAVSLGIFSFWRIEYDHTSTFAAHTLHEVLDIAANFGVAYNAKMPQAGSARYPQIMRERMKKADERFLEQYDRLAEAIKRFNTGFGLIRPGRTARRQHKEMAAHLLVEYGQALDLCRVPRQRAESATTVTDIRDAAQEYAAALRQVLDLYDRICALVVVQGSLAENDRDAMGASGLERQPARDRV
ncbi:hypothetical protein SSCG_06378 [Streptomyces clavuligerus]|nr:hypothetical protein [Streptomyces clavuligerus]EDY53351.1 hypothetical protein SSCG_06378 [Streptomyces clavuligerus]